MVLQKEKKLFVKGRAGRAPTHADDSWCRVKRHATAQSVAFSSLEMEGARATLDAVWWWFGSGMSCVLAKPETEPADDMGQETHVDGAGHPSNIGREAHGLSRTIPKEEQSCSSMYSSEMCH